MTASVNSPRRADELEPGMRVSVSDTTTLTVADTQPGEHGDVSILWEGITARVSLPADREFDVITKESTP